MSSRSWRFEAGSSKRQKQIPRPRRAGSPTQESLTFAPTELPSRLLRAYDKVFDGARGMRGKCSREFLL